ncbi:helix-turn-helix transcriptional regulator [Solwaraspora sp. WMMD406]|uniref:helix-turn-helix transcriptional regulator n=1 Tax=Solwaraspora sp. WMMD406 TaxID=3016095 RepID=UPI002416BDE2|nr:helix-turn-helix transcriptional regulator [Solwaraspora sp. WMMD406]MDG4763886.1 helix-turn-helix transcriptional regulator [Solwaraspora sp. WMMD406]
MVETVVVVTKDQIAEARRRLGLRLAIARNATGWSQSDLARQINYSRSTVASVETGSGKASQAFWATCDQELGCQGSLVAEYDRLQDLIVKHRQQVQRDERFQRARRRAPDHSDVSAAEPFSLASPGEQAVDGSQMVASENPPGNEEAAAVDRRGVVQMGGAVMAAAFLDRLWSEPSRMHEALDRGSISAARLEAIGREAADLGVQVVRVPPATVLAQTLWQFRNTRRLLETKQTLRSQRELSIYGAMFATITGEILFNQGEFPLAAHWYAVARRAAEEAGNQFLADIALAGNTYLPTYTSDPRAVLASVIPRLDGARSPSPAIAWLWAFRAKAHAMLADANAFQRSIERARDVLDRSPKDLVKPGIFSFLPEKLAFYEARGWVELRNADMASVAAERAISLYDLHETTEPALARFEQASAYAQSGEVAEACRIATGAILDHHTYHGITVIRRAREFDRLVPESGEPARQWREVLHSLRQPQLTVTAIEHGGAQ